MLPMEMGRGAAGAVSAILLAALACSGGGAPGTNVPAETWSGALTGTALGPFVCLAGTDGWYDESASVAFDVAGTLATAIQGTTAVSFAGTFSGSETAHEASGTYCAPPPSVASTTRSATPITIRAVNGQLQLQSASVVLMPAHFANGGTTSVLDSTKLVLSATTVAADRVDGTWYAVAASYGSPVVAQGAFVLTKVSAPPPAPTAVTALRGAGDVTVSWAASPTASSYRVYYRAGTGVTPANGAVASGITATSAAIGGLTPGTAYSFVVTALNSAGESAPSAQVSATPSAPGMPVAEIFALGGGKLEVFPRTASGNVAPARSITGLSTALSLSVDATNSEVAVLDSTGAVRFYALGASGAAAPLRTLAAPYGPCGVRVDPVNDEVAVCDGTYIYFFARTATGSAAPLRTLQVVPPPDSSGQTPSPIYAFTIDPVNDEVLAVTGLSTAAPVTVHVFARTATGLATPLRTLAASAPLAIGSTGVAVDAANDELWVTYTSYTSATQVFSRTASGTAAPLRSSALAGSGIYVDPAHGEVGIATSGAIQVLSRATLATLRTISGSTTGFASTTPPIDGGP